MGQNFVGADRDQALLMPPSLRDWVPDDHLAWFVIEAVEHLDLAGFYARYRDDGWGRAAFEPKMMVALLLYAYARGVRSSREIERRLVEDVAFRVIAANLRPDHSTICRFRQAHEDALNDLFVSVLGLCVKAELVDPKVIAIDGTKIAANASGAKNITEDQLKDFANRVFREAEEVDAGEDRLYGDRRGDELPEHLRDRDKRVEWIREQLAQQTNVDEAYAERMKERAAKERETGKKVGGRKPKPPRPKPKRVNTTDPDSRPMKTPTGYVQGFNAQLAVTEAQVIVAVDVTNQTADAPHFAPMVERVNDNLNAAGVDEPVGGVVADAGYFSDINAALDRGPDVLIAPVSSAKLREGNLETPPRPDHSQAQRAYERALQTVNDEVDRRAAVMQRLVDEKITSRQAATELWVSTDRVWQLKHAFLRHGRDGLMPRPRLLPRPPEPHRPTPREAMLAKFTTQEAVSTYAVRARCAEPVIGQLKEIDGLRRFSRRGRRACFAELHLQATAHNLKKLWRRARHNVNTVASVFRPSYARAS